MNLTSECVNSVQPTGDTTSNMPSPLHEALLAMTHRLRDSSGTSSIHTVLVTATDPQSGVSYISSCMATVIAERLGSTLLIDGQAVIDLANKCVIPGRSDCTHIFRSKLWAFGAAEVSQVGNRSCPHKVEELRIIESLAREFEYVIIDAPSLSQSRVAKTLATAVDGSILVVVQNDTDLHDVSAARVTLTSHGGRLLGAIYNASVENPSSGELS